MFGVLSMALRFVWLAIMVLGIRQAVQMAQQWIDELVRNIERGQQSGAAGSIIRLHEALLRRPTDDKASQQASDVYGEL